MDAETLDRLRAAVVVWLRVVERQSQAWEDRGWPMEDAAYRQEAADLRTLLALLDGEMVEGRATLILHAPDGAGEE